MCEGSTVCTLREDLTFRQSDRACHAVNAWSGYISSAAFSWDTTHDTCRTYLLGSIVTRSVATIVPKISYKNESGSARAVRCSARTGASNCA
jgi:hypothetical protein